MHIHVQNAGGWGVGRRPNCLESVRAKTPPAFPDDGTLRSEARRGPVEEEGYARIREEINFSNRPPVGIQLSLKREARFPGEKVGSGPTVSLRELSIPRRAREAMERGLSLMHEKSDYPGSLAQFQRAVREYPQYYEAYMQMGVVYMKMGDTAKAEEMLRTSIDMSQRGYADPLFMLASVYSGQKRFADAETMARDAVTLNPNSGEAHQELARALHGLGQGPAAEASALDALRLQPDNPQIHLLLANIHLRMRNYAALIKDLDSYLELAPNGPDANQARQMREQISSDWLTRRARRPSLRRKNLRSGRNGRQRGRQRHGRDLFQVKAGAKHRQRRHAAPAAEFPLGADEFHFRTQRQFQHGARLTAIETLRELENRVSAPGLPVGRAPDGNVQGFLLDLIADEKIAEKRARGAGTDVHRLRRPRWLRATYPARSDQIAWTCSPLSNSGGAF